MGSGPGVVVDLDNEDVSVDDSRSISQMMSSLKSAFILREFAQVETVLISREEKLKVDIENLKKENQLLKQQLEKLEAEKLDYLGIQMELEKCEKMCAALRQLNSRLSEESNIIRERDKISEERIKKLLADFKKVSEDDKKTNLELTNKICELDLAREKAEAEVQIWKGKFWELDKRVSSLEETTAKLMDKEHSFSLEVGVHGEVVKDEGMIENGEACHSPIKENGDTHISGGDRLPLEGVVEIVDSDDDCDPPPSLSSKEMTSQRRTQSGQASYAGAENGGSMLKRKRSSSPNMSKNKIVNNNHNAAQDLADHSPAISKEKTSQDFTPDPAVSPMNHCSLAEKLKTLQASVQCPTKFPSDGMNIFDSDDSSSSSESESDDDLNFWPLKP